MAGMCHATLVIEAEKKLHESIKAIQEKYFPIK